MKKVVAGIKSITVNGQEVIITNNEATYVARTKGTYTIIATDKAGNSTTKTIEVLESEIGLKISSTKYMIDNDYISKIPINTTIKDLLEGITTNITDKKVLEGNTEVIETNILKTGMILQLMEENEKIEYVLAVTGDCTGDGKIDFNDILSINKHRLNKTILTKQNKLAANFNDDEKIDFNDILAVNKYRLKRN